MSDNEKDKQQPKQVNIKLHLPVGAIEDEGLLKEYMENPDAIFKVLNHNLSVVAEQMNVLNNLLRNVVQIQTQHLNVALNQFKFIQGATEMNKLKQAGVNLKEFNKKIIS